MKEVLKSEETLASCTLGLKPRIVVTLYINNPNNASNCLKWLLPIFQFTPATALLIKNYWDCKHHLKLSELTLFARPATNWSINHQQHKEQEFLQGEMEHCRGQPQSFKDSRWNSVTVVFQCQTGGRIAGLDPHRATVVSHYSILPVASLTLLTTCHLSWNCGNKIGSTSSEESFMVW